MFSLKPGRGKSFVQGLESFGEIAFGVIWYLVASEKSESSYFPLIGIIIVLFGIGRAVVHFYNAFGKNRFSIMDATADGEEPDPFAVIIGKEKLKIKKVVSEISCPYCGKQVEKSDKFCSKCGSNI